MKINYKNYYIEQKKNYYRIKGGSEFNSNTIDGYEIHLKFIKDKFDKFDINEIIPEIIHLDSFKKIFDDKVDIMLINYIIYLFINMFSKNGYLIERFKIIDNIILKEQKILNLITKKNTDTTLILEFVENFKKSYMTLEYNLYEFLQSNSSELNLSVFMNGDDTDSIIIENIVDNILQLFCIIYIKNNFYINWLHLRKSELEFVLKNLDDETHYYIKNSFSDIYFYTLTCKDLEHFYNTFKQVVIKEENKKIIMNLTIDELDVTNDDHLSFINELFYGIDDTYVNTYLKKINFLRTHFNGDMKFSEIYADIKKFIYMFFNLTIDKFDESNNDHLSFIEKLYYRIIEELKLHYINKDINVDTQFFISYLVLQNDFDKDKLISHFYKENS